ncbi:contractile injection system tape measure protein [Ideonella sp. DXS29W]|uniref:Contractile injection system tape measure protein n=1 Tax=Ideonella lacteola TaxID=2984193 RepID=A0ABU9BWY9_9BURK
MNHRVETMRCELRFRSPHAALEGHPMQDRLARFFRGEGLRQIEARFDRHDRSGQVWQIDRLEIDLGRLSRRQDPHQWAARLDEALDLALARARQRDDRPALPSARLHAIDQFLFYLENGHLPWGVSLPGRRASADWLAQLARAHGVRLWAALQGHAERDHLLQRLSLISPHHGLHALLAQRDAPLAASLQTLDDTCLLPLQAHGWLSAHQRQQLQQALRSVALRVLWGARGSALGAGSRPQLLAALRAAMAQHIGPAWAQRIAALPGRPADSATGWLGELLASPAHRADAGTGEATPDAEAPTRTWEAGLQQLREALSRPRRHSASHSARIATLLGRLSAAHPAALRSRLLQWAGERRQRRQWSQCLSPENTATLIAAMSPAGAASRQGHPGSSLWSDSLRQTAMRLQREAPADRRPGLGRLQALLLEACLQRLVEGQRLPDSHSAWQALWQRAWEQWLGHGDETDPRLPGDASAADRRDAAADPATSQRPAATSTRQRPEPRPDPRNANSPAREADRQTSARRASDDRTAPLDQALQHLERQCREGQWAWPQRLRLARLLETPAACERWMQLFDESRRWQMLKAQFGPAVQGLQQRAGRLQQWLTGLVREPVARVQEHWRRLCRYLFIQGLSPDQAALRSHYQAEPVLPRTRTAPPAPTTDPIWVGDAGQVLLAAYAERLFKQQKLIDQGRFIDAHAQARGVQCLQTLCHGPGPVDEAQTVLSRLLCGVPPAEVLPEVPPLPDDTVTLLEQLLQAVIAHWKAVGHTSVAGLRESFLRREGRLLRDKTPAGDPPRWRLRVQTRGFDVLLDRLPWSFQTIRLPWMQGALHVEWR